MKQILFLLLLPFFGAAQFSTVDTVFLKKLVPADTSEQITYYQTVAQTLADGSTTSQTSEVGDSATVVNYYANQAIETSRLYASYAVLAMRKKEALHAVSKYADALEGAELPNLYDVVKDKMKGDILGRYTYVTDAGNSIVSIIENNTGAIRLDDGAKTYRITIFSDKMMRVFNWPNGAATDIYQIREGVYSDFDRTFILRKRK